MVIHVHLHSDGVSFLSGSNTSEVEENIFLGSSLYLIMIVILFYYC